MSACDATCEVCGTSGSCESNGACDIFDCIAPNPPPVAESIPIDNVFFLGAATPPAARGGTVRDGRYTPARIDVYGDLNAGAVFIPTYEFRARSVQIAEQDFIQFSPLLGFLPAMTYTGTFVVSGITMTFDVTFCDIEFQGQSLRTQTLQYTATANGLVTISQQAGRAVAVSYTRQ